MSEISVDRLLSLWQLLAEAAGRCDCASLEDVKILRDRAVSKGLSCLTDDLATFGRYVLNGLRNGYIEGPSAEWCGSKVDSTLPLFLISAMSKVFGPDGYALGASFETAPDGSRRLIAWQPDSVAGVAVVWLRQLTVVFAKMRIPHSTSQAVAVRSRFVENEQYLASVKGLLFSEHYLESERFPLLGGKSTCQPLGYILLNAARLIGRVLCNADVREIVPRHGSGASACGVSPWKRYDGLKFDAQCHALWPYPEYAAAGKDHTDQILSSPFWENGYSKRARGVFVPKDSRGPRLISCEPASSMYYQQGLMTLLVDTIEKHSLTSGFVNFTDQRVNQVEAHKASVSRENATIDLKDASDLLSWDLVVLLWPKSWVQALRAVRSSCTEIDIPQEGSIKVPLRKHAPMGSAVCFPVMALTLWALIKAARFSNKRSDVFVYGDDIICRARDTEHIIRLFERVGLKVNTDKSFYNASPFRESCGKEYWDGRDVTPVYCRAGGQLDDTSKSALCAFATNIALQRGLYRMDQVTQFVSDWTGCPIVGIPEAIDETDEGVVNSNHEFFMRRKAAAYAPEGWEDYESNSLNHLRAKHECVAVVPHIIYGAGYLCQLDTVRKKRDKSAHHDYSRWVYRIRVPEAVHAEVETSTWGYALRSLLIGGDLGMTGRHALAKRVSYKYGWLALD